jgi:hypothetical protein
MKIPLSRQVRDGIPAKTLDDAVKLCDPYTPLDATHDGALHCDLSSVRGGDRLGALIRDIRRRGSQPGLHFVTGHVGSGKSTELSRLRAELERVVRDPEGRVKYPASAVVLFDALPLVNTVGDLDLEDLLVGLWDAVYALDDEAASEVLTRVWKSQLEKLFKDYNRNLVGAVREVVGRLVNVLQSAKPDDRMQIRSRIANAADTMIDGLNDAFEALRKKPGGAVNETSPVVVIIDNLEKLTERSQQVVEHLYLERIGALRKLVAHVVITTPTYLAYNAGGSSLSSLYGGNLIFIPMVRMRARAEEGGAVDSSGVDAMVRLLCKRVDFERLFEGGREAAAQIAALSGGCIRDALRLTKDAINQQEDPTITAQSLGEAIRRGAADMGRALSEARVKELITVRNTNRFSIECSDSVRMEMMRHLQVLAYQNGEPEPYFVVHPLLEQTGRLRA